VGTVFWYLLLKGMEEVKPSATSQQNTYLQRDSDE
jgi:hypothetical protein